MRPEELPAYLAAIRARVGQEGPSRVAYAMARAYHEQVTNVELVRYSHKRLTRTPAPPGGPPAIIGGHLKRSVRLYPAVPMGEFRARANVKPTIVYARIQELGGTVTPNGHPFLRFKGMKSKSNPGGVYFVHSVTLPARPYMRPVHRRMIADGSLHRVAVQELRRLVPGG